MMKVAAASGSFAFASMLAACGGDDDDDDGGSDGAGGGAPTATTASGTTDTPAATAESDGEATEPAGEEGEPKMGGELILGFNADQLETLDPAQSHSGPIAGHLIPNLFSGLVQFDESYSLVPDLAENWDVSADGTIYTFHLREGLKFHNGDPLIADDIIYTYERTINPDFASSHAYKLELIEEMVAEDDLTLTVTMSDTFAPFLAIACVRGSGRALIPISRRAIEEMGDEQFGLTPIGCGPFMMLPETQEVGRGFEMVAWDEWYGGRPYLDKITVQVIPEPSSQVNALIAGDIDMINVLPASGAQQVESNDDLVLVQMPAPDWRSLSFNMNRPPWDNKDARLAVAKAIDRDEFIEKVFFGLATPSVGPIQPPFAWAYLPPDQVENPQAYDLDAAKQLAEKVGLEGQQPVLITRTADQRNSEALRIMLQDIGLDVQIELLTGPVHTEREEGGDFDMSLWGSGADADPDDAFWNFFHSEGARNVTGFKNARVDELLEGCRTTTDLAERAAMYQEAQQILLEEVPCAFTRHLPDLLAYWNYIKGYRPISDVRHLESVWLDK
jgi:peptide/nickel transport system substrate-binding protein